MAKGEQTHQMIVARAAQVFNRQGYFGSSLDDLMHATGLKKGGIYNHFHSKDELALEAFDYAVEAVWQRVEVVDRPVAVHRQQRLVMPDRHNTHRASKCSTRHVSLPDQSRTVQEAITFCG